MFSLSNNSSLNLNFQWEARSVISYMLRPETLHCASVVCCCRHRITCQHTKMTCRLHLCGSVAACALWPLASCQVLSPSNVQVCLSCAPSRAPRMSYFRHPFSHAKSDLAPRSSSCRVHVPQVLPAHTDTRRAGTPGTPWALPRVRPRQRCPVTKNAPFRRALTWEWERVHSGGIPLRFQWING